MIKYMFRRVMYAIPILFGINLLTFALFFMVNTPDDIARMQLGNKHVEQKAVEEWKEVHGYNLPLFFNESQSGFNRIKKPYFSRNH